MSAHPSATSVSAIEPEPDIEHLDLSHRDFEVAAILAVCFEFDGEARHGLSAIRTWLGCGAHSDPTEPGHGTEHGPAMPHRVIDMASAALPFAYAQLAAVLMAPIARLVDQCLEVDDRWAFDRWPSEKQVQRIQRLFVEAGIGDRFVAPRWAADPLLSACDTRGHKVLT